MPFSIEEARAAIRLAEVTQAKRALEIFTAWRESDGADAMDAYSRLCEEISDPIILDAVFKLAKREVARSAPASDEGEKTDG